MGETRIEDKPASVLAFLVKQCSFAHEGEEHRPIMISNLDDDTFFVAVEQSGGPDGRAVYAVIFVIDYDAEQEDGFTFGYREFHETEGPFFYGAPPEFMDLLTPTDSAEANEWRHNNLAFIQSDEGRACAQDAVVTDLRIAPAPNAPRH